MAIDLALNKSCVGIPGGGAIPGLVNDGDDGTFWNYNGLNGWWRVDLGSSKSFNTLKILLLGPPTYSFVLEGNDDDGVTWNLITTGALQNYSVKKTLTFAKVTYRYVRFRYTDGANWSRTYTLELFELGKGLFTFTW